MDNVAMNLTRLRNLRGLSQQALADMIGRDKATISRAESMFDGTTLGVYKACADALKVTLADIFSDSRSEIETELIVAFRGIPPERHAQLLGLLKLAESHNGTTRQEEN